MSNTKVLVVEDDEAVRTSLVEALEEGGYRVITATNGARGFELVLSDKPDVLVLDLLMPVVNGQRLLEMLRTMKCEPPNVVVISASGNHRPWTDDCSIKRFLRKPFSIDDLLSAVQEALEEPRGYQEKEVDRGREGTSGWEDLAPRGPNEPRSGTSEGPKGGTSKSEPFTAYTSAFGRISSD